MAPFITDSSHLSLAIKHQTASNFSHYPYMAKQQVAPNPNIAANLKVLMEARPAASTQMKLAQRSGVKQTTVSRAVRGAGQVSAETLKKLADALDCEVGFLYWSPERFLKALHEGLPLRSAAHSPSPASGHSARPDESNVGAADIGQRRIPVISFVRAGHWAEAADPYAVGDGEDFVLSDLDVSDQTFAVRISGDSMEPDFKEGDLVIIDPNVSPRPGDFVVAKNGHEEATFKKYRPRGMTDAGIEVAELVPLNPDYPIQRSDLTPFVVIGTMVEHRRYRRR
jgi:SOS-response transcriptional repressor LexA